MKALSSRFRSTVQIWLDDHKEKSGQDLIEYVLILALIMFGVVLEMGILLGQMRAALGSIVSKLLLLTS